MTKFDIFICSIIVIISISLVLKDVNLHNKKREEAKEHCQEICLNKTIEDHYKCCNDCYTWEMKR